MSGAADSNDHIGGEFCRAAIAPGLLSSAGQHLTPYERNGLWRIFQAIGRAWDDLHPSATDSSNLKSTWLDFIEAKTNFEPSYIAEYSNAVLCVDELIEIYGESNAFSLLFFRSGLPQQSNPAAPPMTRLAHAKKFVIDEFIRVNVVASGFKSFGREEHQNGVNYNGYLGGSRYNLKARVRDYKPSEAETPK
ncbi:MAG: hypothetical protein JSS49_20480 [Planctomycetes bacterium]|nr:hypothetical protein [Planctomycetota bacterium]